MKKRPTACLGLMSGTSLDGVDAAIVITDGENIQGFSGSKYYEYSQTERKVLRAALGKWPGANDLGDAQDIILSSHQNLIEAFPESEVVGFHGQTLAHDPANGRTHQLGDGQELANRTGKPVVWDFRNADMAAGGQGAPLAPFFHFACAKALGARAPLAFLNLGGVGNVTFVNGSHPGPEAKGALLAFDTGPANAPLSDLMQARRGLDMDENGKLAALGAPDGVILEKFMENPYFEAEPPKSLDRDDFSTLNGDVSPLSDEDAAATLTAAIVSSVYAAQMHFPTDPSRWLICGGGRKNQTLMTGLRNVMDAPLDPVEVVGFDGDMFEAQAFGYLAMRVMRGLPTSAPSTTGASAPIRGGQISYPN
ncbi:MAG: anhydro-N-acetylmuramic acid kinase [Pseudomonadota bacterium]